MGRNLKIETWTLKIGTWNSKLGIWNLEFGTLYFPRYSLDTP
jgi:hypothetical protein